MEAEKSTSSDELVLAGIVAVETRTQSDFLTHGILKLRRHLDTETYGRVAMAIL